MFVYVSVGICARVSVWLGECLRRCGGKRFYLVYFNPCPDLIPFLTSCAVLWVAFCLDEVCYINSLIRFNLICWCNQLHFEVCAYMKITTPLFQRLGRHSCRTCETWESKRHEDGRGAVLPEERMSSPRNVFGSKQSSHRMQLNKTRPPLLQNREICKTMKLSYFLFYNPPAFSRRVGNRSAGM